MAFTTYQAFKMFLHILIITTNFYINISIAIIFYIRENWKTDNLNNLLKPLVLVKMDFNPHCFQILYC